MHNHLPIGGIILFSLIFLLYCERDVEQHRLDFEAVSIENLMEIPPVSARDEFGFVEDKYEVESYRVQRNESLYIILRRHGISPVQIYRIQQEATGVANVNRLRPGQHYHIYSKSEADVASAMVWNINRQDFLVMRWEDDEVQVHRDQHEMKTVKKMASGTIQRSLYETLQQERLPQALGSGIANIFAWEIDFFSLRSGDSFKVIYDELYIGDEFYGIGSIQTAEFEHRGATHRAYYFDNGSQSGYFNEDGNSLERDLLKAPFRYDQRVSSRFSRSRFHPILKERRPHHGVDYAAPRRTPVIAVGDGLVTEARYRGGNGNIVQIRHNSVYKTAYLHLNGFASGIRAGATVEQGQVIGYVGQTGLATGFHLCYRLYVDDQPVNSLTADLPVSESLDEEYMEEFQSLRIQYDYDLAGVSTAGEIKSFSSVVGDDGKN